MQDFDIYFCSRRKARKGIVGKSSIISALRPRARGQAANEPAREARSLLYLDGLTFRALLTKVAALIEVFRSFNPIRQPRCVNRDCSHYGMFATCIEITDYCRLNQVMDSIRAIKACPACFMFVQSLILFADSTT